MFEHHVLDSRLYSMKMRICVEYWHQDHGINEMNMIWSSIRSEEELSSISMRLSGCWVLVWNLKIGMICPNITESDMSFFRTFLQNLIWARRDASFKRQTVVTTTLHHSPIDSSECLGLMDQQKKTTNSEIHTHRLTNLNH